jgi:transposase
MIFPSNRVRIMVATKPVDFRKGHDGLAALVKNELHKDPFTGTVFVFRSRKAVTGVLFTPSPNVPCFSGV